MRILNILSATTLGRPILSSFIGQFVEEAKKFLHSCLSKIKEIFKMILKLIVTLLLLFVFSISRPVSCFWLTDTSLFLPPISIYNQPATSGKNDLVISQPEAAQELQLNEEKLLQIKQPQIQTDSTQSLQQLNHEQQQQCQCNANWLENQTSLWLNKWLNSAQGASQMRLFLSNSTGANINRRDAKQKHLHTPVNSSNNNSIGNHLAQRKGSNNNGTQLNSNSNSISTRYVTANKKQHELSKQLQPMQMKLVQGERGPKGETGARGEKGANGLISVKDRDGLFDLPNKVSLNTKESSNTEAKLVFIESEQMLVVGTESGWRPVQLLPALRDFRKTIAKFSLTSSEQRKRLLKSGGQNMDNSIKPLKRPILTSSLVDLKDESANEFGLDIIGNRIGKNDEDDDVDDDDDDDDEDDDEDGSRDDDDDDDDDDNDDVDGDNKADINSDDNIKKSSVVLGRSAMSLASTSPQLASARQGDKRMKLRIAALNEPFSGNIHGIRGADFECKRNAARANVKGSFRAFLASGFQNLNDIVRYNVNKYPIVNLRGDTLANSWHDLFRQPARIANPLSRIYSFDGRHVASDSRWPNKLIWHGANNKLGHHDSANNCDGWHSESLTKFGYATPLYHPKFLPNMSKKRQYRLRRLVDVKHSNSSQESFDPTYQAAVFELAEKYPCRMPLIVLCIETVAQQSETIALKTLVSLNKNNEPEITNQV